MSVVVGLGLNSRATSDDVLGALDDALASVGRSRSDELTFATAEHRRGHPALRCLPVPVSYFSSDRFAPGEVAERAARLGSPGGQLLVPKRCTNRVCVSIVTTAAASDPGPSIS